MVHATWGMVFDHRMVLVLSIATSRITAHGLMEAFHRGTGRSKLPSMQQYFNEARLGFL
jgi:hypothetical protein